MQSYDSKPENESLATYYCDIGLDDADVLYSLMAIKEMEFCGYGLNEMDECSILNNSGILVGNRKFISKNGCRDALYPPFHVPLFKPTALNRVPEVDRTKMLFPINLAEFVYPRGIRIMSAFEVKQLKKTNF